MAKTEVILIENVVGLGAESDQIKVAAGFARNYLFPQRLAVPLTSANKRRIESLRQRRAEREAHEFNTMNDLSKGISKLICVVKVKTGDDGKMFGTVTPGTISDELKHQFDISLDKKKIHLDHPIRTLGDHEVEMRLHPEVRATLKVRVESTTPLPQAVEGPAEGKAEGKEAADKERSPVRTEKRGRRPLIGSDSSARPARSPRSARPEKAPRPDKTAKPEKPAAG